MAGKSCPSSSAARRASFMAPFYGTENPSSNPMDYFLCGGGRHDTQSRGLEIGRGRMVFLVRYFRGHVGDLQTLLRRRLLRVVPEVDPSAIACIRPTAPAVIAV